jgi:hypothetical protein
LATHSRVSPGGLKLDVGPRPQLLSGTGPRLVSLADPIAWCLADQTVGLKPSSMITIPPVSGTCAQVRAVHGTIHIVPTGDGVDANKASPLEAESTRGGEMRAETSVVSTPPEAIESTSGVSDTNDYNLVRGQALAVRLSGCRPHLSQSRVAHQTVSTNRSGRENSSWMTAAETLIS